MPNGLIQEIISSLEKQVWFSKSPSEVQKAIRESRDLIPLLFLANFGQNNPGKELVFVSFFSEERIAYEIKIFNLVGLKGHQDFFLDGLEGLA